jgi:uncharacterized protein YehS (DUF1456 family)
MNNNDVIRSLRHVLNVNESAIAEIFKLSRHQIDQASIANLLKEPDEAGFMACPDTLLSLFLDGLISSRRGKSDKKPEEIPNNSPALDNNLILKKLRIAFDLKEDDLLELMSLANYEVSKSELSSVFRKPGNKHYRECNDDFLMGLLLGLTFRQW